MSAVQTAHPPPVASAPPLSAQGNPWKGLHSYTEEDQRLFFGRSEETEELLRLIRRDTLCVLFARSGMGKTSLLGAGVLPRLRQEGFLPVLVRLSYAAASPSPTRQILAATLAAASTAGIDVESVDESGAVSRPEDSQDTLWELFHRYQFWGRRNDLVVPVLLLDQFEEAFLARQGPHLAEFGEQLADLVQNRMPRAVERRMETTGERLPFDTQTQSCRVVLSLREDFVHRHDSLREIMPAVMRNRFVLAPLDPARAIEVVRRAGGQWVSIAVAREIVAAVAGEKGAAETPASAYTQGAEIEPAYLSVMCHELFQRMVELGRSAIGSDLVAAERGNILDSMYERSFQGLAPKTRLFVEDRLLTASGFRGTVPVVEAVRDGVPVADLECLVDRRLLRFEDRLGTTHVELSHDLLTRIAQKSRDQRQAVASREAERKREMEYRAKLRQTRQRAWAVAGLAIALLGVMGFYYLGSMRPYYSYCRNFTKQWGVIHPVGQLPRSAVAHRSWTLRLTQRGRFGVVQRADVIDANGQRTPNHNITTYLTDSTDAPISREKESQYEFVHDREGRVVYEIARDRFNHPIWGLVYSPHTEPAGDKIRSAKATFLGPDGYPLPQGHSRAEFVNLTYDERGFEVAQDYTNRTGRSMPGPDDAYGRREEYDKEGRLVRIASVNELGKPMNDKVGNAGQEFKYDKEGNVVEARSFDAKGEPTLVKGEYYGWLSKYDKWGRMVEQSFFGLSGEPVLDADQTGAHRVSWSFDDHGNPLSTRLYDTADQPMTAKPYFFDFPAHEQKVTFDQQNRATTIAYFAAEGKPLTGEEGWHGYRIGYDKLGFVTAIAYFDKEGKPALSETLGANRWEKVNDAFGQPIEERFFDSGGKPVPDLLT